MPLTTSTITGRVPLPNDAAPLAGEIVFTLSGFDTEGNQVIPGGAQLRFVLTADGSLPADAKLWRNTAGLRGTAYHVQANWTEANRRNGTVPRSCDLGFVQIGSAASYTLAALLANPASAAPGWYESVPRSIWEAVVSDAGFSGLWAPGGSLPGGPAVRAGQIWLVTAAGTSGGQAFTVGDRLVALVNGASATVFAGNWLRVQQYEATQSAVDVTAGRITKTGDGGILGAAPVVAGSANDYPIGSHVASGQITETEAVSRGLPALGGAGTNVRWWIVTTVGDPVAGPAARVLQEATEVFGIGTSKGRAFRRVKHGADWSAWGEFLIGAIERGSNANGDFVRYPDGTQECWRTLAASASAGVAWTFPAAFSAAPVVNGTAQAAVLAAVLLDAAPTATGATLSVRDKTDARRADVMHLYAKGRWF